MPLRTLVPMHMPLPRRCCHAVCRLQLRHGRQSVRCKSTIDEGASVQWLTPGSDPVPRNLDAVFILAGALHAALELMFRWDGTEAVQIGWHRGYQGAIDQDSTLLPH